MTNKQLQPKLPEFNLPDQFKLDKWEVKEWDLYKNATENQRNYWDKRSSVTGGTLDFTLCNNLFIREELKYVVFMILASGINVASLGTNYDYLKSLCKYLNDTNQYNSLVNYTVGAYTSYFAIKLKRPTKTFNSITINKDMEQVQEKRTSSTISFLTRAIKILNDYHDEHLSLMERDYWERKHMISINSNVKKGSNLNFSEIRQESIKKNAKEFCLFKLSNHDNATVYTSLLHIRSFSKWLFKAHPEIKHLSELNRGILEDFFLYLRIELDCSDGYANREILHLKIFFETLMILECENVPEKILILANDYTFKSKKESKYFTPEESQNITNAMKYMTKTDAKIVFCLKVLGCRIGEILNLKVLSLCKNDDGTYYLKIPQEKVKSEYIKELPDDIAKILLSEISKNKKKFSKDPLYIFLNDKGEPILYSSFMKRMNKLFYDQEVKDRNGNLLRFQSHRFRATVATNLINAGYSAKQTAEILGHSNLESLTHYIHIHDETVIKQLAPRLAKDDALIRNIGLGNKIAPEPVEASYTPLCNGWCVRDITKLGACKKANSCLSCGLFKPSIEYLNNYEMQLQDVLATIEIAKANNMEVILNKNLKLKEDLEKIIHAVKEKI